MAFYLGAGMPPSLGVTLSVAPVQPLPGATRLLLAITGTARVGLEPAPDWVPGGLGDPLTSYGGDLQGGHGQSTVLDWIASGATASHGAVSEPSNHPKKFAHPQVLLLHYLQGSTAIEAYWKSVVWPQRACLSVSRYRPRSLLRSLLRSRRRCPHLFRPLFRPLFRSADRAR